MTDYKDHSEEVVSRIQTIFIIVTIIFLTVFYSVGCLEKTSQLETNVTKATPGLENNAGISKAITDYLGTTLGQIVAVENYNQVSAQAVVTLTMPKPDVAKVYLNYVNQAWAVERVEKGYSVEDNQ